MNFKSLLSVFKGNRNTVRYPPMLGSVIYNLAFFEIPKMVFNDTSKFIDLTQAVPVTEFGTWSKHELGNGKMAYIIEFNIADTEAVEQAFKISPNKAHLAAAVIDTNDVGATEYFVLISSSVSGYRLRQVDSLLSSSMVEGAACLPTVEYFSMLLEMWKS